MRYAIIESGGKQYRAIEGGTIEVDRLAADQGKQIEIERVLFLSDEDQFLIGTPTLSGVHVKATVLEHLRGPKVDRFKYSPKKRIRVRGGHRQQYTRLMVDFIGKPGEGRKAERAEAKAGPGAEKPKAEPKARTEKPVRTSAKEAPEKSAEKKTPARKSTSGTKTTTRKSGK